MPVANLKKIDINIGNIIVPSILKTPTGLLLIEVQGTLHIGQKALVSSGSLGLDANETVSKASHDLIGVFDFSELEKGGKEIVLNVDQHQRLRGKIVKLKDPIAILRTDAISDSTNPDEPPEIPIVDIVEFKAVFSNMPEPIVYK